LRRCHEILRELTNAPNINVLDLTWMNAIGATIFGLSFIFLMTSAGSAIVFFFHKQISPLVRAAVFGFAGGVMFSASFWGLLTPSFEEASEQNLPYPAWIPTVIGFFLGCVFLFVLDILVPLCTKVPDGTLQNKNVTTPLLAESEGQSPPLPGDAPGANDPEELKARLARAFKLFLAITIHNIPEGVACGLACGIAFKEKGDERKNKIATAVGLAIGIGVQDVPEGAAVSLPIREISGSTLRGFIYGVLSGLVEPIAGALSFAIATFLKTIDPWALAFSGGAMIYVTVEELIPEAMEAGWPRVSIWMFNLGFILMMIGEQVFG
jgi:ZIP family zinc transporter